jgi:hypothetical protein
MDLMFIPLTEHFRLLFKFRFHVKFCNFGVLARWVHDLIWGLVPVLGSKARHFLLVLHSLRARDSSKNSKYGAAKAPDWDSFHLQNLSAKNAFAWNCRHQSGGLIETLETNLVVSLRPRNPNFANDYYEYLGEVRCETALACEWEP